MSSQRPFIDYYERLGRSPVGQDISDLQRHLERRSALYRMLGLPPRFFALADVLEFGPGLGHNALHVATLQPRRHVLVDASPSGLSHVRATLRAHFETLERFEIVECLAETFEDERGFDVVLAENMIPMQRDPVAFCRRLASHVRPGGVFVLTCMTASSTMGENLRRLVALKIAPPPLELDERVRLLSAAFAGHLESLGGASRSIEDWIKDNVTHPLDGAFFSMEDAIGALDGGFDVYGSSPDFLVDWRWYKRMHGDARAFNARAREQYRGNVLNLMDWSVEIPPQDPALGVAVDRACDELFWRVRAMESGDEPVDFDSLARACDAIAAQIRPYLGRAAAAFHEVAAFARCGDPVFDEFASYFGRGIQYASFIRRPD